MFWKRCVAVCMEGRPPSTTGLPSLSPAIRRCAPKHSSVDLALSWKAGGIGLSHEAVHFWILVGCSSRYNGPGCYGNEPDRFCDVLWLDPDVPVAQVNPQMGSIVKFTSGFSEDDA